MKILVGTLLASVVQLGNILALSMFFFGIFAILGISLWAGLLHYRCRATPEPVNGDWPVVEGDF
jgi:voltage-dependent calcium channel L type alpha-1D